MGRPKLSSSEIQIGAGNKRERAQSLNDPSRMWRLSCHVVYHSRAGEGWLRPLRVVEDMIVPSDNEQASMMHLDEMCVGNSKVVPRATILTS